MNNDLPEWWLQRRQAVRSMYTDLISMPASCVLGETSIDRTFSAAEYAMIQQGFYSGDMGDKWFVFWEDDWLFIHRSWTGLCCYEVQFVRDKSSYRLGEVWFNPEIYQDSLPSSTITHDQNLRFVLEYLLLGAQHASIYLTQARKHKRAGQYHQALASYRRYLAHTRIWQDYKQAPLTLNELGDMYRSLGDRESAIACYRAARTLARHYHEQHEAQRATQGLAAALAKPETC